MVSTARTGGPSLRGKNDKRHAVSFLGERDRKDYFGIPVELNLQVSTAQEQLRGKFRDSLCVGARLGGLLTQAKEICRHGEFLGWLERGFKGSARHAQRLMRVARMYPNPEAIPALSLRQALRLIAGNEPREKTVRAQDTLSGETCSVVLATIPEVFSLIENRTIAPLKEEGVSGSTPP